MLPKVVIVGRPNVGKSSLLNLLAGRLISIVDPTAGTTRDRIATRVMLPPEFKDVPGQAGRPQYIELIDTGGYGIEDTQNLTAEVERQIALGLAEADLILFVVDAQAGVMPLDEEVAKLLRTSNRVAASNKDQGPVAFADRRQKGHTPVLLVANKVDSPKHEASAYDAARLGFGDPMMVSAVSGHNFRELIEAVRARIDWDRVALMTDRPETEGPAQDPLKDLGVKIAVVGKRNAGKSTLVNNLAGTGRMIVSEVEGTTRDSVDVRFDMDGKVFTAIDTAGVRKGKSLKKDIEYYSQHRALRSVRRADVVLFIIDSTVPISQVDHQLGNEILRHFKPTVLVVNKWDLAKDKSNQEEYLKYLEKTMKGFTFAPIAFISAKNDASLNDIVQLALTLYDQSATRVPTSKLNAAVEKVLRERPPTSGIGRRIRVYYAAQIGVSPPTVALVVNDSSMIDPNYMRYMINRFREELPYAEVPIKLVIRGRDRTKPGRGKGKVPITKTGEAKVEARGAKGDERGPQKKKSKQPPAESGGDESTAELSDAELQAIAESDDDNALVFGDAEDLSSPDSTDDAEPGEA